MQKLTKRLFALLLAAVMVVGLLPVSAFAARAAEGVTAEVPMEEDADRPVLLAAADSLTIPGYTRVTSLPEGGLEDGYYLLVAPYGGNYYMLYPGATGGGQGVTNSARLVVGSSGAATGYKVGTSYDSAATSDNFSAADNLVTPRGESNGNGALYAATAVGPNNATYYLCKKGQTGGDGAIYHTNCESAFTIHPLDGDNAGYFNLKHEQGSFVLFYTNDMNFNQLGNIGSHGGNFMIFKSNTKEPPVPTAQLQALIDEVNRLTQANYTPRTWAELQTALEAANSAVSSRDYRTVKNALSALTAAKNALQTRPAVPTPPAATVTYPEATADTLEEGVYTVLGQGDARTVILYNSDGTTNQSGASVSNGQLAPGTNGDRVLWKVSRTADGKYTIQGTRTGGGAGYFPSTLTGDGTAQIAMTSTEANIGKFTVTKVNGGYQLELAGSAGNYLSFHDTKVGSTTNWFIGPANKYSTGTTSSVLRFFKQTSNIQTAEELRPAGGTTQNQPFPNGPGTVRYFYRIPALVTIKSGEHAGRVVAMADARWTRYQDALNIDTIVSYSDDGGKTWRYSYPNFFGDTELTAESTKAAIFIDPVLATDNDGNLYLMADAFPAGVATANDSHQRPQDTTGFVNITRDGQTKKRMALYTSPENSAQTDDNYSYYIGDFAPIGGSTTKYATIWDAYDHSDSGFYVDDHFYLYKKAGTDAVPANDLIYCEQLNTNNGNNGVWVQQNVFFWNATLHVRNAQYLYLVKSTDGGETWSAPMILNDQVRTGEQRFYGPGPGAGICLTDGTVVLPCYQSSSSGAERSSFIYSSDGGVTWTRTEKLSTGSESTVVEIDSTTIRQFYRDGTSTVHYIDQIKGDDGVWAPTNEEMDTGAVKLDTNQISALRYSKQIDGKTIILVSTASSHDGNGTYNRHYGKIHAFQVNEDKTMTLLSTYDVNTVSDWYGYSSLAELQDGSVGLLYEDAHTWIGYSNYCGIRFVTRSIYDILLPGLVARAGGLTRADYTAETWSGLAAPLAAARAVLNGTDSTTTAEAAYNGLNAALKALRKVAVTISGTVTANGTPVVGAAVTLEDNSYNPVGLTATTDASGAFTFDNNNDADVTLSSTASYKLKVQAPGFTYQVATVNAAAFNDQKLSSNTITLTARPAATYTNDFNTGDISMLEGATGDAATAKLTVVDHNGSKAVKISGLVTGDTPVHVLDKNAHKLRNGVVAMDITTLANDSHRFGFALRADGAGQRVWVGHFEDNSANWNFQSYDGGFGSIGSGGPLLMKQNVTRHVEVEMDGTTLKLWVDGIKVGEGSELNIRDDLGYVGISSTRSSNQFIIDNIYVRRTDPKFAVTLTADGGTLTGKVVADGQESPLTDGAAYEGDTVVITGTGDTGKCLGGITLSDTSVTVTRTPVAGGGYEFSFVMPDHAVTVTGNFKTAVTGANITGRKAVAQNLTATALAGEEEIPAAGATYLWSHQETSGWRNCTDGTSQTKTVKPEDQGKYVKVRVEGTGDYAGWFEKETDEVIGPADVETTAVTITRDSITMWKNLDTDPDNTVNSVEGRTTTLTAVVDPHNATNKTIAWSSSNDDIATVDQDGLVTAVGNGTADIKAEVTSANGTKVSDTVAITVKTGITDITLTTGSDPLTSASVLTIYANDGDANKSVTVNAAVNDGADAADLVWSCGHDGEDHIFQLGGAGDAGAAAGGSVAITAYHSHTLVGEETVTVSAPATTGNTATAVSFKVKVVHKLDADEHSVSIAGTPKVGTALSVNLTNLPMSAADKDKLTYQWKRTKDGTTTPVGTGATYTPTTADDVGGTITVTVTATAAGNFYYEGSLTSAATAAVEKMDAPDTPALSPTKPGAGQEHGYITITNYNDKYTYQIKSGTGGWENATVTSEGKIEGLAPGTYFVKIKETTTQKESAVAAANISAANAEEYAIAFTQPTEGAVISVADKAAEDAEVIVTVTVTEGWQVDAVKINGNATGVAKDVEDNIWTFTMPGESVTVTAEVSKIQVTITHNLSNLTCDVTVHTTENTHVVDYGTVHTITLTAAEGYDLPSTIQVTTAGSDGNLVDTDDAVSYSRGTITFANGVTQDITITAAAIAKTYTASFSPATGGNLTRAVTSTTPIAYNSTLTATLTPDTGYSAPAKANVEVTVGGDAADFNYSVDGTTGVATVTVANVKGNVVIKAASAVKNTTAITAASISGDATEGNTLSITGVLPAGATYSVSWQRADTQDGPYAQIAATDTYQLTADDVGKYFKAVVSGTGDSRTFTTDAVGPVKGKVVLATSVKITAPQDSNGAVVVGSTLQLTATLTPANATASTVKWSSSNTSVATVDENTGVVTPVKVGTATILATVINSDGSDGVTDSIDITVEPAPIALLLTGSAVENETLTAELTPAGAIDSVQLRWYRVGGSEDLLLDNNDQTTYILTADDIGYRIKVTASVRSSSENYTGSAEAITPAEVVAAGGEVPVEGVSLDKSTASVAVGKTMTLTATVRPANATNQTVSWVSDNELVATVEQNGVVTGVTEGTAVITVRTTNGNFTAICTVSVTAAADKPVPVPVVPVTPSDPGGDDTTTTTTTNPDGTTTTTVTDTATGTVTETTEKEDGTVEIKETLKDGTVTETTKNTDGSSEVVETKPDGTVTETNTDAEGGKVEKVTDPEKNVAITVTDAEGEVLAQVELPAEIPAPETRFEDVPEGHWADQAIHSMAAMEVVKGVGDDRFDMDGDMTRGALATVLSRLSNGQEGLESSFADVAADEWYADGIAWAAKTGIVTGYSETEFGPNDIITREQLAVMLCRYARLLGMDTTADSAELDAFNDGSTTHDWAADSIAWCVANGILRGMGNETLAPTATATRAQVAVMLQRFIALLQR